MWNFEAKAVLGYVVTMCDNLPQGSAVGLYNIAFNHFTEILAIILSYVS